MSEHLIDAENFPLDFINENFSQLDKKQPYYIHCAGGYRSMMAASILQARGYRNFSEVEGGFNAIANTTVPKTDFVCQSKLQKS